MIRKFLIIITSFVCCFSACIHEVVVDEYGESEPRLTVFSVISPDNKIQVYVNKTLNYGGAVSIGSYVENAIVCVRKSGYEWDTLQPPSDGALTYQLEVPEGYVENGVQYFLEVSCAGFPSVSATTTVPQYADNWDTLYASELTEIFGDGEMIPGYRIFGQWQQAGDYNYENIIQSWSEVRMVDTADGTVEIKYELSEWFELNLIGNGVQGYLLELPQFNENEYIKTDVFIATPDVNFSAYLNVYEYFYSMDETPNGDLAIGTQSIIPEFTNIENGYGVFGSYLLRKRTFYY